VRAGGSKRALISLFASQVRMRSWGCAQKILRAVSFIFTFGPVVIFLPFFAGVAEAGFFDVSGMRRSPLLSAFGVYVDGVYFTEKVGYPIFLPLEPYLLPSFVCSHEHAIQLLSKLKKSGNNNVPLDKKDICQLFSIEVPDDLGPPSFKRLRIEYSSQVGLNPKDFFALLDRHFKDRRLIIEESQKNTLRMTSPSALGYFYKSFDLNVPAATLDDVETFKLVRIEGPTFGNDGGTGIVVDIQMKAAL